VFCWANPGWPADLQVGADMIPYKRSLSVGPRRERFGVMIAGHAGPSEASSKNMGLRFLPAGTNHPGSARSQSRYVTAIDGEALGLAVVALAAVPRSKNDQIKPAVGIRRSAAWAEGLFLKARWQVVSLRPCRDGNVQRRRWRGADLRLARSRSLSLI